MSATEFRSLVTVTEDCWETLNKIASHHTSPYVVSVISWTYRAIALFYPMLNRLLMTVFTRCLSRRTTRNFQGITYTVHTTLKPGVPRIRGRVGGGVHHARECS